LDEHLGLLLDNGISYETLKILNLDNLLGMGLNSLEAEKFAATLKKFSKETLAHHKYGESSGVIEKRNFAILHS